jgi:predicted RNase H-like HicB family nuclease
LTNPGSNPIIGGQKDTLKSYVFKVVVEDDQHEDGRPALRAYCPALESIGASTWGNTREDAMKNIQEVLHMIVDELAGEGKEVPPDSLITSTESPAVLVTV